jgi:hypothetical protein
VGGIFLILGRSWARWVILAWLAFHVYVGATRSFSDMLSHLALLLVISFYLLTPPASTYFRSAS